MPNEPSLPTTRSLTQNGPPLLTTGSLTQDEPPLPQIDVRGLATIGRGLSGHIYALDEHHVVKYARISSNTWYNNEVLREHLIERSIYERLGSHPRICKYYYPVQRGLVLERHKECLRKHLMDLNENGSTPSYDQALQWSLQVAEGLAYIHAKAVLQADIGCHNLLLDQHSDITFCDFAGSAIDGQCASVAYEERSQGYFVDLSPTIQSELFALGSTIYEIWTTKRPYQDEPDESVAQHYKSQRFPDLEGLPPAHIIKKCWMGSYSSAMGATTDLQSLQKEQGHTHENEGYIERLVRHWASSFSFSGGFSIVSTIVLIAATTTAMIIRSRPK